MQDLGDSCATMSIDPLFNSCRLAISYKYMIGIGKKVFSRLYKIVSLTHILKNSLFSNSMIRFKAFSETTSVTADDL